MTLVWEPLAFPPGDRREPAGRVSLLAATAVAISCSGAGPRNVPSFRRRQTGSLGSTGHRRGRGPGASAADIRRRPGKVELRITVEGATGGTLDAEVRDIEVPDFTSPQDLVEHAHVSIVRARCRSFGQSPPNPNAVPAAVREFSGVDRVLIRFSTYGPGTEQPEATAVLLNRAGQKISDVPVTPSAVAGTTHEITLASTRSLRVNTSVEVTVKGASGEAKTLIPLRVGADDDSCRA